MDTDRIKLLTRDAVSTLATDLEELEEVIADAQAAAVLPDGWTNDKARALGWLEGAADAADMTIIEFVDANT